MNQGKSDVVKQEMARVNISISGFSELRWTGVSEFNSGDHYVYYCGQESLRRNGVAVFCAVMGTMKGRSGQDLIETDEIKKRWQEYTEELYKKCLNDLDNHDGVPHPAPDILECEVTWALGSITLKKASGGEGIQLSCFKCCTQHVNKFGKLSIGHKDQFSFQSIRREVPKNAQTTGQLYSFCMLVKIILKILQARLQHCELRTSRCTAGFRKGRGTKRQTQCLLDHRESKGIPEKHLLH